MLDCIVITKNIIQIEIKKQIRGLEITSSLTPRRYRGFKVIIKNDTQVEMDVKIWIVLYFLGGQGVKFKG